MYALAYAQEKGKKWVIWYINCIARYKNYNMSKSFCTREVIDFFSVREI